MTSQAASGLHFTRREWLPVVAFALVLMAVTSIPYFYAQQIAAPDQQFMGVVVNMQDHLQYFSWMREAREFPERLAANQLTPETSTPLLFNLLWYVLGRIQDITGLDTPTLFQATRWLAGLAAVACIYFFAGLVFRERFKRWLATLLGVLAGGVGYIWVIEQFITDQQMSLAKAFTLFTAEPNTFYTVMAFPHFTLATALITLIFGVVLIAQRTQNLRYAWLAAAITLFLSLQHAYDMFTIYGVIGMYGLFLWLRDRRFPLFMFKTGVIILLISVWPALQAFLITNVDEVWRGVLAQFDNAGAWTPAPYFLPLLMGFAWLLAIWAIDVRKPLKERDDTDLFILAWFLAHFILVYLPFNFQIHLLSGWQVITGVLATIGISRRLVPLLRRLLPRMTEQRRLLVASGLLLALVVPVNLYLFAQRFLDLRRADAGDPSLAETSYFFLSNAEVAAFDYIEAQATTETVVLSGLDMGQFVPALTGGRSFIGHWAQTLNFFDKREMVAAFFNPATDAAERQRILADYKVAYVYYGPEEAQIGDYDPSAAAYLEPVFTQDDVTVYRVASG